MFNIAGKKITILGGKRSGMALAKLVLIHKGLAKVSEMGPSSSYPDDFVRWAEANGVHLEFNGHTQKFIEDSDIVVLSPGVPINSRPVQWATDKGILVLGEIEFAFQFCKKPVIAITGSNGKTTSVSLMANILKEAGFKASLCGNVGTPFSQVVADSVFVDYFVLEISSFQLESLLPPTSRFRKEPATLQVEGFKPLIGVILNFSQNHLDRHKDIHEYLDAKKRLFLNHTSKEFALLNAQCKELVDISKDLKSEVAFFNNKENLDKIVTKNPNHMAIIEAAKILGIKEDVCLKVFSEFKGVEHRMEIVRTINGVDFINDSKATTVEAGRWALANLDRPILMICGGKDKKLDFNVLRETISKKVKKMYLIGEAKDKLNMAFKDVVPVELCSDLKLAVDKARQAAVSGDCVLLSPMCASFDMFNDYEHRGQVFKEIVNKLS